MVSRKNESQVYQKYELDYYGYGMQNILMIQYMRI